MTKIIQSYPSIQIELPDGAIMEIIDDYLTIYEKGDIPGMADPLNEYAIKDMYRLDIDD